LPDFTKDMPILRIVFQERVFFDTGQWSIRPDGMSALDVVSNALKEQSVTSALFVAGHTDSRGADDYNIELSVKRASSVAEALLKRGVGQASVWKVGFGKEIPLRLNDSESNMALNRRVEFLLATQPSIIATWIAKKSDTLCENRDGCGEKMDTKRFVVSRATLNDVSVPPRSPTQVPTRQIDQIEIDLHQKTFDVGPPRR
jgi:OOP family OmpA-OmpF porin